MDYSNYCILFYYHPIGSVGLVYIPHENRKSQLNVDRYTVPYMDPMGIIHENPGLPSTTTHDGSMGLVYLPIGMVDLLW